MLIFGIEEIDRRLVMMQLVVEANVYILLVNGRQNLELLSTLHNANVVLEHQLPWHPLKMLPLSKQRGPWPQELFDQWRRRKQARLLKFLVRHQIEVLNEQLILMNGQLGFILDKI